MSPSLGPTDSALGRLTSMGEGNARDATNREARGTDEAVKPRRSKAYMHMPMQTDAQPQSNFLSSYPVGKDAGATHTNAKLAA